MRGCCRIFRGIVEMILIKNEQEIMRIKEASLIAAKVLEGMCKRVVAGLSTYELDQIGKNLIEEMGAESACFNYQIGSKRYPSYTCLSVNEEVVHGIGTFKRILKRGDVIAIDVSVVYNDFIADNARTVFVESASDEAKRLIKVTEEALYKGIAQAKPGNRVGDISAAIQEHVEKNGFSVVRDFVGHGVGRSMHEEPAIPNFGRKNSGPRLKAGMTLAIEPMVNAGGYEVKCLEDGWTIVTSDGTLSAHFEHTVLVSEKGPEILTILKI